MCSEPHGSRQLREKQRKGKAWFRNTPLFNRMGQHSSVIRVWPDVQPGPLFLSLLHGRKQPGICTMNGSCC